MSSNKHFLSEIEEKMLDVWEKEKTFEASLENRSKSELFNFYDGPPFANGMPHYGHFVQTTIKDTITRYKTMRGYYVPRRVGWDTHGLPVEYAIEKEHDFKGKQDIIKYGIDKFNAECRESVFKYKSEWEKMFKRVGRWADYDKTYATLDNEYIESVWWVFKSLFDKELIYKDYKSLPYCPRCATPLSNFELNQGYQDGVKDPSLFVKFKIKEEDAFLLGWTTTPWSLPGNSAIAVKNDARYLYVKIENDNKETEVLVLAADRLEALNKDNYHVVKEVLGKDLVGLEYEPLFNIKKIEQFEHCKNAYKVWAADFVSIEDGTGVLHVAPAFGEDDLKLSKKYNLPIFVTIDEDGSVKNNFVAPDKIHGRFFKQADKEIIAYLTTKDRIFAAEMFEHTYPFCWRCDTPLLYYATDSWQIKVAELSKRLVQNNKNINWSPGHIRDGRFGNWLSGARDWAISRNRFWGAPIPVWKTDDGEIIVVGSIDELKQKSRNPETVNDLHRPYIDDVEIITDSGKIARRIPEVFDCWFESGSMPYAQNHYPFESKEEWEKTYPADFIAEAIDQTRGWFYTLHVLATALFDKPAFKNVICTGWVVAADGEKLSKRKKNYAPMDEVFDLFGVDTLRFFMSSSPIVNGEDVRFSVDFLRDVQRKVFMTFNNVFNFYKLYADVDGWKPKTADLEPSSLNLLDKWILSRLNTTIEEVTQCMDSYRLDKATRPIVDFLDDTSNWFVRRSRRRFWKSEDDVDKQQAYETLHFVITRTCQLLAPFSPFLSDFIWREINKGSKDYAASVHLSDWPKAGEVDNVLINNMNKVREYVTIGLAERASNKIKVRQPLNSVTVPELPEVFKEVIADELNVKNVKWGDAVVLDCEVTDELKSEGLMRDVIRVIQSARKEAGLNVDDRIELALFTEDEYLKRAIKAHLELICTETLTVKYSDAKSSFEFSKNESIEGKSIDIKLNKIK